MPTLDRSPQGRVRCSRKRCSAGGQSEQSWSDRRGRLLACPGRGQLAGYLENNVGERVAPGDLLANLNVQVVGGVSSFPIATRDGAFVEGGIGVDGIPGNLMSDLRNQYPTVTLPRIFRETLEGGTDAHFVSLVQVSIRAQRFLVGGNGFVGGLDRGRGGGHK